MIKISPMRTDHWQLHKTVRTAALADAPYAYSTTLESALARSDDDWVRLTEQYTVSPNSITCIAFDNEIPCGMSACVMDGDDSEMFAVWVDPAHRRKGVGRALVDFACEWSEQRGAQIIYVGVYEDNQHALVFYRSVGFVDRGEINPVLSTDERKVLMLTRELNPAVD